MHLPSVRQPIFPPGSSRVRLVDAQDFCPVKHAEHLATELWVRNVPLATNIADTKHTKTYRPRPANFC